MLSKADITKSLEESIKTLTQALNEREDTLRALLYANSVSRIDELDDIELYRLGSELEDQIDTLEDLLDELKYKATRIGAFKAI